MDILFNLEMLCSAAFGAIVRLLFGLFKRYDQGLPLAPQWKRIGVQIVVSVFFGLFAVYVLARFSGSSVLFQTVTLTLGIFAGYYGPDLLDWMTRKFTKKDLSGLWGLAGAGLSERQQQILEQVRELGIITNHDVRKLCSVSDPTATRELETLVKKKLLTKQGKNRGAKYMRV